MIPRDRVKVSDIERCFPGVAYSCMNMPKDSGSDSTMSRKKKLTVYWLKCNIQNNN